MASIDRNDHDALWSVLVAACRRCKQSPNNESVPPPVPWHETPTPSDLEGQVFDTSEVWSILLQILMAPEVFSREDLESSAEDALINRKRPLLPGEALLLRTLADGGRASFEMIWEYARDLSTSGYDGPCCSICGETMAGTGSPGMFRCESDRDVCSAWASGIARRSDDLVTREEALRGIKQMLNREDLIFGGDGSSSESKKQSLIEALTSAFGEAESMTAALAQEKMAECIMNL
uniref:Uncharacterized protein n=1 Tax=Chromera velia CCMP2878 TaxID=1169474 RepID=A0A0G4IB30_9ALVE|eukprot:Cvel_12624.t1-p1 / transcript=Cvel_12624.t1 / gene=Cvel_12624 / organism=Chromera_velia_CCMP2878 / gene_product=hypothetical protein / transcript_product=hypothetical protein / location=Cvel_scaffold833:23095-23796(-) / protein_length=234 / sequence_SO=supercontig / SO=protein_coding / is_pseudo=false